MVGENPNRPSMSVQVARQWCSGAGRCQASRRAMKREGREALAVGSGSPTDNPRRLVYRRRRAG